MNTRLAFWILDTSFWLFESHEFHSSLLSLLIWRTSSMLLVYEIVKKIFLRAGQARDNSVIYLNLLSCLSPISPVHFRTFSLSIEGIAENSNFTSILSDLNLK